jgi:DNA-directed RNA polymerase specialized sigma subunit
MVWSLAMNEDQEDRNDLKHIQTQTFMDRQKDLEGHLLDRSEQMDKEKKSLLRLILNQGGTHNQVARLSGGHSAMVSCRFRSMLRRLRTRAPLKTNKEKSKLNPLEKTIMIESFVYGSGQKQIPDKLGISRY